MTNSFEPNFAEAELHERLRSLINRADNFLAAAALPVPAQIHATGLTHGMESIRAELLAIYMARGGENDWEATEDE